MKVNGHTSPSPPERQRCNAVVSPPEMAERTHVSVLVRPIHATALHVGGVCLVVS